MKKRYLLSIYFFFEVIFSIFSQDLSAKNFILKNDFEKFKVLVINDSIQEKTYNKLEELFNASLTDSLKQIYAKIYLKKAKKESNTIAIANGYGLICKANVYNPNLILQYSDSIIEITKNSKHLKFPTRGYLLKGFALLGLKRFNESLEVNLKGLEFAKHKNDISNLIAFKNNLAILKNILGKHHEALLDYQDNLELLSINSENIKSYQSQSITTLFKIADTFNSLEEIDSANFYLRKALTTVSMDKGNRHYPGILLSYGVNSFKKGNYKVALDSLQKAEKLASEKEKVYTYLGKNLLKLKRTNEALVF